MKIVKILSVIVFGSLAVSTTGQAKSFSLQSAGVSNEVVLHGGGCRKSSPPGQCCHMERKTGIVHCH